MIIVYYGPGLVGNWAQNLENPNAFITWLAGWTVFDRFVAVSVAFIINYACYFSEIFRGGIEAIPKGQYEAGQVLGMTRNQIFRKVVFMQVVKRIIPPMSNEIITLVKDTSLARVISVYEIIWAGEKFMKLDGLLWPLFYTGVFYLIFCGILTVLFNRLESWTTTRGDGMAFLEVKNLQKRFGNTEVLKGIDFSLEKGDVLVIIGSSGSGKTTLLRCLNFLETPSGGSIAVDGQTLLDANDAATLSDKEIRKNRLHFGLVFQQFNLFPQYKVMDNLTLAPKLALHEQVKAAKKAGQNAKAFKQAQEQALEQNAKSLLERVGLADKADAYPCQLSGGQQQRVAIARALAMSPDILCFDEPTSALDPELTGEVLNVIRSLKTGNSTMIVVTHEMEFARHVADQVLFMADGVIAESGTPEDLFNHPKSPALQAFLSKAQNK